MGRSKNSPRCGQRGVGWVGQGVNDGILAHWHTPKSFDFRGGVVACRVLAVRGMDAQWKKLARPAVAGVLLGLVLTTTLAVVASAAGAGEAPAHVPR